MRRGPLPPRVVLSEDEREPLERWTRRKGTPPVLAMRARIILAAAGESSSAIARSLRLTRNTVIKWRRRFAANGPGGLLDEPRPSAPRRTTDDELERAVTMTLETTPPDAPRWSTHALAKARGMSQAAVARVWKAFAPQPNRIEGVKLSKDPLFIEMVCDIAGLYLNPPDRALVLCVDEKRRRAAVAGTAPPPRMSPGEVEQWMRDHARHRSGSLFETLDVKVRAVAGQHDAGRRAVQFRAFLRRVDASVPRDVDLHLILDKYATHRPSLITQWFVRRPRFHLHFAPTSASWLKAVERWVAEIARHQRERGVRGIACGLIDAIRGTSPAARGGDALRWTNSADELLMSAVRCVRRTLDSRHGVGHESV